MKYPRYACLIILTFLSMTANAQLLARYTVKAGKYARHNTIISVPAEAQKGDVYQLYQVEGKTKTPVPLQAGNGRLVWPLGGDLQPGQRRGV